MSEDFDTWDAYRTRHLAHARGVALCDAATLRAHPAELERLGRTWLARQAAATDRALDDAAGRAPDRRAQAARVRQWALVRGES